VAIKVQVQSGLPQIIVPVRVDRAVRGAPVLDAPDVDDRAWITHLPTGINKDDARGSVFGMRVGDTVRLKLVREDIDDSAPLFVVAEKTGNPQFKVAAPVGGGPLPPSGEFSLKAVNDNTTPQKLFIKLGSADGPIIGEASPHIFNPLTLNVTPHVVTIHKANSPPFGGSEPKIGGAAISTVMGQLFDMATAIWRPMGIQFNVGATLFDTVNGAANDDQAVMDPAGSPPARGSVQEISGINHVPKTCNIYFVRFSPGFLGIGVNRDVMNANGIKFKNPAVFIGVEGNNPGGPTDLRPGNGTDVMRAIGNDLAHEIGHFIGLPHADKVNNPGQPDSYTRRQLMHPINLLPEAAAVPNTRFDDAGYGTVANARSFTGSGASVTRAHRGCMITIKEHPTHQSNPEVLTARRRFQNPNLF